MEMLTVPDHCGEYFEFVSFTHKLNCEAVFVVHRQEDFTMERIFIPQYSIKG